MFTKSDKIVLGICGLITITGIAMIYSGLKGLKELQKREEICKEEEKEIEAE